jgi:glycine/D-amino acid oxidase-like deaminating enzyme/nitrite reductase/ring-hydroxylating ferredoxin subunit
MANRVLWFEGGQEALFAPLAADQSVDVAIIGAGMAGLHCAWHLRESGLSVAVLEARQVGHQATGRSTAKVTSQHGLRYVSLKRSFGEENARIYAEANQGAVSLIAAMCESMDGHFGLKPADAHVYATDELQVSQLEEEAQAAREFGLPATIVPQAKMPVPAKALLRFTSQYQFNPVAYLRGVARAFPDNVQIYEQSRVTALEHGETCRLQCNGHTVMAPQVVVATQMPVVSQGMFFTKAFPFAHPVAAAPLPQGVEVEGMFLSAGEPSHSFRTASVNGQTYLLAAGPEFTTGQPEQQEEAMADLHRFMREFFRIETPTHQWINEDFRPMDGAAFVGPATSATPNLQIATGFQAWGISQGALAGEIMADRILGREHRAAMLFEATRIKPLAGGPAFISGNVHAAFHLIADRVLEGKAKKLKDLAPGEAAVVTAKGEQLAVRRDVSGGFHVLSAVCTHLGCIVDWNAIDETWDCPCHGSRYTAQGEVLSGPAITPLEPRTLGQGGDNGE